MVMRTIKPNILKLKTEKQKDARTEYMLKTYNLSNADYNVLYAIQDYRCGVCRRHGDEFDYTLFIDHCHRTGFVRGLLCNECNRKLRKMRHGKAKEYLDRAWHPEKYYEPKELKKLARIKQRTSYATRHLWDLSTTQLPSIKKKERKRKQKLKKQQFNVE